ncbi:MAG: ribose 5-phosphate isomerase A [Parafilimonas sp.]
MNLKKIAAEEAVKFIKSNTAVGLGDGSTIAYMVEFLKEENLDLLLYTSSDSTKKILEQSGFSVNDFSEIHSLDIYFDGCDQFDKNLHALKSGSGIHTTEKLLASMARQFILVGDETKYVEELETRFPLVIEVIPAAATFVQHKIRELFPDAKTEIRYKNNTPVITKYSNQLIDIWFAAFPELSILNFLLKNITGVLETSLFYNLASKAILAKTNGIRILEKSKREQ